MSETSLETNRPRSGFSALGRWLKSNPLVIKELRSRMHADRVRLDHQRCGEPDLRHLPFLELADEQHR